MLFIDPDSKNVLEALEMHYSAVKCLVYKKLGEKNKECSVTDCEICDSEIHAIKSVPVKIKNFLTDTKKLQTIIAGKPKELSEINKELWELLYPGYDYSNLLKLKKRDDKTLAKTELTNKTSFMSDQSKFQSIFAYDKWFSKNSRTDPYSAYHLAEKLNRRSCTYCNRIYTDTITKGGKKVMRPQFDHWFPKKKYPLLALSFYNLIPSCSVCNSSIKGEVNMSLDKHLHPYVDADINEQITFSYHFFKSLQEYEIKPIPATKKAYNTIVDSKLKEIYSAHTPELDDMIKIKKAYSTEYIQKIQDFFRDTKLTKDEVYRLLFGTEIETKNFHKRPLSKFKKDILTELRVLKNND